jgi:hypothetical protein
MHPDDLAALPRLDDEAPPVWPAWLGSPQGAAGYLSETGLEVFAQVRREIAEFFRGDGWLEKAFDPNPERRVPAARILSPVLTLSDPAEQFATLLRIWTVARIGELPRSPIQGVERVRHHLRANVSFSRLMHSLAQIELAGAGLHVGDSVELEPPKGGGPGDVRLHAGDTTVFLEVATLATDTGFVKQERALDGQQVHLHGLEARYRVRFDGALPGHIDEQQEREAWRERTERAAQQVAATGAPVELTGPAGLLTVRPDDGSGGQRLTGPVQQIDAAHRILNKLAEKAKQTRAASVAWVLLDDHNDAMRLTDFFAAPLTDKITQLHALVADLLDQHSHLAGVIWTYTGRAVTAPPSAQAHSDAGSAIQRALPGCRVRQSVLIPRRILLPDQTRLLTRLLQQEPGWLDGALARLGYRGGFASLLATPPPATAHSALWTPAATP